MSTDVSSTIVFHHDVSADGSCPGKVIPAHRPLTRHDRYPVSS